MAILCMIYGQSGTGKSTSLRNFKNEEVAVVNVNKKPLPFKSDIKPYNCDDYMKIETAITNTERKAIVIDDATYLMTREFMRNVGRKGYDKYNEMAANFNALLEAAQALPDDKIVYFLGHSEARDDGTEHFKTIGKMLDNYVTVEGLFTIVLKTVVSDGQYSFQTQNSGQDTCKSPIGMFEDFLIPNDLKAVNDAIRAYYGLDEVKKEEKENKK